MNDAPDAEREPFPYIHLPLPVVAGVIVVVLAALLALGLYANANLRPGSGGASPTPAVQAAAAGPTPAQVAVTPTTVVATSTLAPTPLVLTSPASPTSAPPLATALPTVTVVPSAVVDTPTPLPTVEPALAADVGKAYENFWRVRSQAALTLDSSQLSDVMDGTYLQHFVDVLNQLRQEGRAIKTKVTLNYTVVQASSVTAVVHDFINDDSFYVRTDTEDPLSEPANDFLKLEITLRNNDGNWKVIDSVSAD